MTGQVDEAGRETAAQMTERLAEWCDRNGAYITTAELRAVAGAFQAEVAGLRTQLAAADDRVEEYRETTRDTVNHLYATIDRAVEAEAERDVLAGQVAAIRALADAWTKRSAPNASSAYQDCSTDIRAALVASSPTTPEARKWASSSSGTSRSTT